MLLGAGDGKRPNIAGFRFSQINIPAGAIIESAEFSMVKATTSWQRMVVDLHFEATDSANPFTPANPPASRPLTNANAHVDSNMKRTSGERYVISKDAGLANALQEVVNRSGWQAGNSIALVAYGPSSPAWARTDFLTRDAGSNAAPKLTVTYNVPGPATATPSSVPGSGSTMHVNNVKLDATPVGGGFRLDAAAQIMAADAPVNRAVVRLQMDGPGLNTTLNIRTDSNGWATTAFSASQPGTYTATVMSVSKRNFTYDPSANVTSTASLTMGNAPTATATSVPGQPSATATSVPPTATATSIPPTATATTVPPTATNVPPTATSLPPTATDTGGANPPSGNYCSDAVHNSYVATGPDGKLYPTWHPPVDPASGCTFDHEHGDNPNGNPALQGRNVVFCYLANFTDVCMPHSGYKVFAWSNISHYNAPAHSGASVVMVLHQGTSGAGRFTTVFHDIEIHYSHPSDGREAHIYMLAPFGDLLVGCGANDPNMDLRLSQANAPGARQVSADKCFDNPNIPYEDWITALYIGKNSQGAWKAYMDPHFAIFNPNTYCIVQGNSCVLGFSDERAGTGADPNSADSWFKGDKREAYLNQVWINNAGGSTTIWTDAYGNLVPAGQGIPQYIASVNQQPLTNSAAFGADNNHDPAGAVHAPN